jgi:(5-formylfuran-3-yl)methyl phosphate synthase
VRSVEEALMVASGGADFIDLKEPNEGALGGLPIATIRAIIEALRRQAVSLPVSATIGDVPMSDAGRIASRVEAVGACGVDYVKVGIERTPLAMDVLNMLASTGRPIVPVFIADRGLEMSHVARACTLGFPGVMVDTADKRAGSLFDAMTMHDLRRFVALARQAQVMVGVAGALRIEHRPLLAELAPDFSGFRTAVCAADRASAIDVQRLGALTTSFHRLAAVELE